MHVNHIWIGALFCCFCLILGRLLVSTAMFLVILLCWDACSDGGARVASIIWYGMYIPGMVVFLATWIRGLMQSWKIHPRGWYIGLLLGGIASIVVFIILRVMTPLTGVVTYGDNPYAHPFSLTVDNYLWVLGFLWLVVFIRWSRVSGMMVTADS